VAMARAAIERIYVSLFCFFLLTRGFG
jgi:hypothetical protein